MGEPQIRDGDWYPVVPCCPHCRRSNVARSAHRTSLCVECARNPGIVRRTEPLPATLSPRSFSLYKTKPLRWLMLNVGKSHLKDLPKHLRDLEPHRFMHLMVARFWGDEDNDFTYSAYTMPFDAWAQDSEVAEAEEVTDGAPNHIMLSQQRNRHTLHVRMFRNRFNGRVAHPILSWLERCGVPLVSSSIARTKSSEGEGKVGVTFVLDKLGTPMSNTRWHLVLDFPSGAMLLCRGVGITHPATMSLMLSDSHMTVEQPFDIYQIITLWQAHGDQPQG
jgi:hypothetical protein